MKQKERFDVVISGHFFENIIGATNIYVEPNSKVEGFIEVEGDVIIEDHCEVENCAIITKGNIVIGNNCFTDALTAGGDITIGDDSVIRGGIKCDGSVKVGEYASTVWIFGDVGVDIGKESEATSIQTFGDLKLGTKAIAFECCSTEKFECGDGAIVQSIFSGNELKIGKNCQIENGILVKNI